MKIKLDYTTNSSSSSFLIVGVDSEYLIEQLKIAEGKDEIECSHGVDYGNVVNFYGSWHYSYYAGIEIDQLMETMTLPEIKNYFIYLIKEKYNIDIKEYDVNLHYGEIGE